MTTNASPVSGEVLPPLFLEKPLDGVPASADYLHLDQAVLGASGNSGRPLVEALVAQGVNVTAMGRAWETQPFGETVTYQSVDIRNGNELVKATEGMGVVYVATAVPYNTELWQKEWPVIMENVIAAAKANGSKLVFLDNVFMLGHVNGPMTENTPFNPISQKGEVRAQIARTLLQAIDSGDITATIGRSADFYGPRASIGIRFFERALTEGHVTWLGKLGVLRTFNSMTDNAIALAILGNDPRADGHVWHLPAAEAQTGHYFVHLAETILDRELEVDLLSGEDMLAAAKQTGQPLQETYELMYQYDFPYVFDSRRFQQVFGMQPTPYDVGFQQVFDAMRRAGVGEGKQ